MGRWEPNARGRLERAAYELFDERGYEQATVAEIARRAGLTERTFFRHFADKREVLFSGQAVLNDLFVGTVLAAPPDAAPLDAVAAALDATAGFFAGRHDGSRRRQAVITANAELRERELIKMASLAAAVAGALRRRGVPEPAASLTAEAGIAVFRVAFERWVTAEQARDFTALVRESLAELRALTASAS
jgi:AcrR family transcriptional regulator